MKKNHVFQNITGIWLINSFLNQVISNPMLAKVIVRLYCFIQNLLIGFNKHIAYIDIFAVMIHRLGNTEHSGANMVPGYGLVIGTFIFNFEYTKWYIEETYLLIPKIHTFLASSIIHTKNDHAKKYCQVKIIFLHKKKIISWY